MFVVPIEVFGLGEVFKVEAIGTEYCGEGDVTKLNAKNNTDIWVEVVSETELLVSFTSDFAPGTTFSMTGFSYPINDRTSAFVAGASFGPQSFAAIRGVAKLNSEGGITALSGTYIDGDVLEEGCFSSGTFKTVRERQP